MSSLTEHELVDGTLKVVRDEKGEGIVARCTCGWSSGYRFSGATATCAFRDHLEEVKGEKR